MPFGRCEGEDVTPHAPGLRNGLKACITRRIVQTNPMYPLALYLISSLADLLQPLRMLFSAGHSSATKAVASHSAARNPCKSALLRVHISIVNRRA